MCNGKDMEMDPDSFRHVLCVKSRGDSSKNKKVAIVFKHVDENQAFDIFIRDSLGDSFQVDGFQMAHDIALKLHRELSSILKAQSEN